MQKRLLPSLLVVGVILLNVCCVKPPQQVLAQDSASSRSLQKLNGQSRRISGATRGLGNAGPTTKLPMTIILGVVDGKINVQASNKKLSDPKSLVFQRSFGGEKWHVGSDESNRVNVSRALTGNAPAGQVVSIESPKISMDQLLGQSVFRGTSFLTPAPNSRLLSGALTIRRSADEGSLLDAEEIEIATGNRVVLAFTFPAGRDTMHWGDISGKPEELADGLKPGEYLIRVAGKAGTSFLVEDQETVDWVMEPIGNLADLLDGNSVSQLIYSVEYLLSQLDENGRPLPYCCDALNILEQAELTSQYVKSRQRLIRRSLGQNTIPESTASVTGILEIDSLRAMIRDGSWAKAKEHAAKLAESKDARTAGLAKLYSAVISAESTISSVYVDDPTAMAFREAIKAIGDKNPADAFRAHVNFANYLSSKVQARIYNYALQSATELESPLLTAIWQWSTASDHYETAERLVVSMPVSDQAACALNRARHYVVLGDFVRNLRSNDTYVRSLLATSDAIAETFATKALKLANGEPLSRGAALEVLAHIAYRNRDLVAARSQIKQALEAYEQAGALAGIESCHRTLGLLASQNANWSDKAIKHFEVSLQISELLRQQIESNESGADRAGFFARHAYTNERLIDLLVQKGDVHRALEVVEMSKARSFEELLSQHRRNSDEQADNLREGHVGLLSLDDVLADWPEQSCAIEYFIGSRFAYVFCVLPDGQIAAQRLTKSDGQPLAASELVSRITGFLSSMDLRAQKMYREAISGRGFDTSWQDQLHQFYKDLVPGDMQSSIDESEHLVVIPHHVLHYFPFAALVVEPDATSRGKLELAQPEFLIERQLDITVAPSLLSYFQLSAATSEVTRANAIGIAEFEHAPRLAGVEKDLENFKAVFGNAVGTLIESNPISETEIKKLFNQEGLLLIGTHGQNEADRPLASFLLCNSNGSDDGRLTALELFKMPIKSEVVILSACYSGLADRSPLPGDDLFGLQRAILQSGAHSIVSGLWDVYDDTAPQLVKSTLLHFESGKTISRSLAEAQREFLRLRKSSGPSDPWIHPYFWAVYTCNGGGHSKMASR